MYVVSEAPSKVRLLMMDYGNVGCRSGEKSMVVATKTEPGFEVRMKVWNEVVFHTVLM